MADLATYFIWFIIYSFIGWVYEVIVCSIQEKKFVNRGFLNGPYCPIYGVGALLIVLLLGSIENVFLLFIIGAVLTCSIEYFTSWLMEKLFHARWWDYSDMPANINGRVCLPIAIVFGTMSVVLIKFVHPFISSLTSELSSSTVQYVALALLVIFVIDMVHTLTRLIDFEARVKELSVHLKNMNLQERRIIKAFPKLHLTRYDETYQKLKQDFAKMLADRKQAKKHKKSKKKKS